MAGLEEVTRFRISGGALRHAYNFMAEVGRQGYEGLAFFAGTVDKDRALLLRAYVPEQKSMRTPNGLLVHVGSEALYRFNTELYEAGLRFIAQIHSHGEHAYHSETDDAYSMVTVVGGLSLVVPHFAAHEFDVETCAAYRLTRTGWQELSRSEKQQQIEVDGYRWH
jgi:hypothetical protein